MKHPTTPHSLGLLIPLLLVLVATMPAIGQQRATTRPALLRDAQRLQTAERYADSLLQQMTLSEKAAQLIMPMVYPREGEQDLRTWTAMVEEYRFGGVLWQKGSPDAVLRLTNQMRAQAPRVPMLVAIDGEWGLSMRLSGTTRWPRNIVLGAADDESLAYEYGRATAREAKRLGVHVNFAPVIDVNSNPHNPVIGTRSFGSDPDRVAALGIAYARGLESMRLLSTAKHFPGHGDTDTDSHKVLPVIRKSRQELDAMELKPFGAYIQDGLGGMMVGHLSIPSLGTGAIATSATHSVVTTLLRDEMGFDGLIFTDGLGMQGIISGSGQRSVAVAVFKAGADILLAPDSPTQTLQQLLQAVAEGEISSDTIHQRARRLLIWKHILGATSRTPLSAAELQRDLNSHLHRELCSQIYQRGITLLQDVSGTALPLRTTSRRVALLRYGSSRIPHLARALDGVDSYGIEPGSRQQQVYQSLRQYDEVIVAITSSGRPDAALRSLVSSQRVHLLFMTSPYQISRYSDLIPHAQSVSIAYDASEYAQQAAAQSLTGQQPFTGKLPVDLSPLFGYHTGLSTTAGVTNSPSAQSPSEPPAVVASAAALPMANPESVGLSTVGLSRIDQIIERGLRAGAYPGCQVLVAKDGKVVYSKAFGYKDTARREPNSTTTLYDIASMTKALATVPLLMQAVESGQITLDDTLGRHLPYLRGTDKASVRLRDLLHHTAGMPAVIRFYTSLIDTTSYTSPLLSYKARDGYPIQIAARAWARGGLRFYPHLVATDSSAHYPTRFAKGLYLSAAVHDSICSRISSAELRPGRYRYSDIDFILLQQVLEQVYGRPLDQLYADAITTPLGLDRLLFRPYTRFAPQEIAEGQRDLFLLRGTLRGDVDDEAAAMLGGVAGHAGLYGTAEQIAPLLLLMDQGGTYNGHRLLRSETLRTFRTAKHPKSPYALGFDKLSRNGVRHKVVTRASLHTYGHTGFTGTCFWIDPEEHIIFVFLSNRTAPIRWNPQLTQMDIRNEALNAVYDALL